jgi:hypothetical protein
LIDAKRPKLIPAPAARIAPAPAACNPLKSLNLGIHNAGMKTTHGSQKIATRSYDMVKEKQIGLEFQVEFQEIICAKGTEGPSIEDGAIILCLFSEFFSVQILIFGNLYCQVQKFFDDSSEFHLKGSECEFIKVDWNP